MYTTGKKFQDGPEKPQKVSKTSKTAPRAAKRAPRLVQKWYERLPKQNANEKSTYEKSTSSKIVDFHVFFIFGAGGADLGPRKLNLFISLVMFFHMIFILAHP